MQRPHEPQIETCNDACGLVVNFFRAIQHDPDAVASYADHPVWEVDKHAIHTWLTQRRGSLAAKLEADEGYFDVKTAGWYCWGNATHIGSGYASGEGPWRVINGELIKSDDTLEDGGINRSIPHLAGPGQGVNTVEGDAIREWFRALYQRFRRVRITCGDWSRITGPSITYGNGLCGCYLDPPYKGFEQWYNASNDVSKDVREWAVANGDNRQMRIVLSGYFDEHDAHIPPTWERVRWVAQGGYGLQRKGPEKNENNKLETMWCSPHCLKPELDLFSTK